MSQAKSMFDELLSLKNEFLQELEKLPREIEKFIKHIPKLAATLPAMIEHEIRAARKEHARQLIAQEHAHHIAEQQQAMEAETRSLNLRARGQTGAASEADLAERQKKEMQRLVDQHGSQQQIDALKQKQAAENALQQRHLSDQRISMELAAMREDAQATGNPADREKAGYESDREKIIREIEAAAPENKAAARNKAIAELEAFTHQGQGGPVQTMSGADALTRMIESSHQSAPGAANEHADTLRQAQDDITTLTFGGSLKSDLPAAAATLDRAAGALNTLTKNALRIQLIHD